MSLAGRVCSEGKVLVIDPGMNHLEVARRTCANSHLEYVKGNAETFPYDKYDVIIIIIIIIIINDFTVHKVNQLRSVNDLEKR